eukprot:gene1845-2178_t
MQLVKALGCNSLRFSFEWSRIEPQPGQVDRQAIARYHEILDCMEHHQLMPNATLHHFTHPQWFEAAGGFSKAENIPAFEAYCQLVFQEFGHRVPYWATFNEPSCFSLCGYIMGLWAPGQRLRFVQAGKVLSNMLKAHVSVYHQLKSMPAGQTTQVALWLDESLVCSQAGFGVLHYWSIRVEGTPIGQGSFCCSMPNHCQHAGVIRKC